MLLEILTKSRIRQKIILLFVYNREKEFYLSEVARQVKTSAGTAQRELGKLCSVDLLTFRKRGHLSFFKLNQNFPFLNEIEVIVRKTFGIEHELKTALTKVQGISWAFLFGSYVSGNLKSDSDIDLFVIGDADEDEIYRAVRKVEEVIGREINYHLAGVAEFVSKAKENSFFKEILAGPRLLIGQEDELRERIS
jgi:predicted nucleotidyltransferase/predicted transcriptional regulator with HTH domain